MGENLPLLLSAALGKKVTRPPVWMMRQAGRYMKIYRDLRERYPSFRERSENPELSYEISMQPFHAFKPDGVILFSDILTPLPGMGINFEIIESKGPIIEEPIRTLSQIEHLKDLNGRPEIKNLINIFSALNNESVDKIISNYVDKDFKIFKKDLSDLLVEKISLISSEMNKLLKNEDYLDSILKDGNLRASEIANESLTHLKNIIGLFKS